MWYKMVQPPLAVASVHFVFCLVYLSSEGGAAVGDFCTDVSYWDVPKYQTTIKQCCETELKQMCTFKKDRVCKKVPDIQCEVVAWPLCESTPTLTESKKCEVKYQDYSHIHCKDVKSSITHTKKVPECREITRENCVTDWKVDANGNKVWSGKETCTPVRWEECGIVERQVELPMMRTDCDTGFIIKWVDIVDKTKYVTGLNTQCQVKSSVDCKTKDVTKCASMSWEECSMVPAEECQPVEVYTPSQEKVHRKNCFNPNAAGPLLSEDQPLLLGSASPNYEELTSVQASPPDEMHNIGKLLSGYDIMKGNPLPVEPFPVDPGFRQPIFEASYQSGSTTADLRYRQPDGTTISSCIGACSLNFESTEISGSKSYQESLALKVGLSVGGSIGAWEGKFSASVGYKEVAEKTSSDSHLFTLSSASCCAYSAEILFFNLPSLSKNFRDGVETLTEKYDERIYLNFIQAFGTHFIRKALMGALYGQQSEISKEAWTTLQENGIDISTAAELSAYGITGSASGESAEDKKKAAEFSKKAEEQKTYTIGVKPPADGKKGTWLQKTISDPAPIELTLGGSILDLLGHDDIKAKVSTAIMANMKKALDDYCNLLLKSGEAKTCSSPGPDPAFPSRVSDTLYKGQKLKAGEFLRSDNGVYKFLIQNDGNMVIYQISNSNRRPTWESDTKVGPGSVLEFIFQKDGNLVLYNNAKPIWASHTSIWELLIEKTTADALVMQDDGILVLHTTTGDVLWASNQGYIETPGINSDAFTSWGKWGEVEKCSYPHFVNKMDLKYDPTHIFGDNTALNAIRLTCADGLTISSTEGDWGSWRSATCPEGEYINAARIQSEEALGGGDDTAANGIRFKCTDGSEHRPLYGDWGTWRPWKFCQDGSAIYGIQTLVEPPIDGDDTALNNVKFFCAKLPNRG